MFPQIDLRVHTDKMDMASVILAGPGTIEQLVILLHQQIPPLRVLPNPACKGILDGLLLLLGKHRLLLVQDTPLFTILLNGIINAAVPQIQGVLQNLVGVGPVGAVGFGGHDIIRMSISDASRSFGCALVKASTLILNSGWLSAAS